MFVDALPSRHALSCRASFPLSRHARPRSGIQEMQCLILAGCQRPQKAELVFLDPRFRKHDGRRGVAGGGFFHGWGCLLSLKNGIRFPGSKAFARMTLPPSRHARPRSGILFPSRHARPRSGIQDNDSLFGGASRSIKAVFMLPGCSHTQA